MSSEALEKAKRALKEDKLSCALVKGGITLCSDGRGVDFLLRLIDEGYGLENFSAADKIVGKAAAALFVLLKVKEVFAVVITNAAVETLKKAGIGVEYETLTKEIINRKKTGLCPMEIAVKDAKTPEECYISIKTAKKGLQS